MTHEERQFSRIISDEVYRAETLTITQLVHGKLIIGEIMIPKPPKKKEPPINDRMREDSH
jgi:hypothetical protein